MTQTTPPRRRRIRAGDPAPDGRRKLTCRVPVDLYRGIGTAVLEAKLSSGPRTLQDVTCEALREWLERHGSAA